MVFHWSLINYNSLQISRIILSIKVDFSRTVIWMVSFLLLVFTFPSFFFMLLGSVPRSLTTIGITVTFMFYIFFSCSLARSIHLSIFLLSFILILFSFSFDFQTILPERKNPLDVNLCSLLTLSVIFMSE